MACEYSDIRISPLNLWFEVEEGTTFIPPYQYIQVEKVGHDLTPRWRVWGNAAYCTFTPESGSAPDKVRVGIRKESLKLEVGRLHADEIHFENKSGSAILPSSTVTVYFKIKPKPAPPPPPAEYIDITISPHSLQFVAEQGSRPDPKPLYLEAAAPGAMPPSWHVSVDAPWAVINRRSGVVPCYIEVHPASADLAPNTYQAFLKFTSSENVQFFPSSTIPITLTVKPKPEPPPEPEDNWFIRFIKWLLGLFGRPA